MEAYIQAVSYYVPDKILTNEELIKEFPEWSVDKIAEKIGVNQRHIADVDETSADLAIKAAENLFKEYNIDRSTIDFILFCTQSPDYFLPTSACLIQERLQLPTSCGALDFNLGCSGYIYGLSLAKGLVLGEIARNVLLLTGETYSKFIHPRDKGNRTIFGDAGSATLISSKGFARIGHFSLGTDGRGGGNLIVNTGGMKKRNVLNDEKIEGNTLYSSDHLYMNGSEIFNFTIETVPLLIENVLIGNNLVSEEIDRFIFHQANRFMLNYLRKKMKIEESKFSYYMSEIGNTVSNTIPIVLYEDMKNKRLSGNVLLAGFGVGYSWGATILNIGNEK